MPRIHPAVVMALLAAGAIGLVYATTAKHTSRSEDELSKLLQTQNEILQRLYRLEAGRSGSRLANGGPQGSYGRRAGDQYGAPPLTSAQIAQMESDARRSRESKFVDEPLSAAWAARTERSIGTALSATNLSKEGARAPIALESSCHSQTCRISMSFADEVTANFTKVVFMEQLAETLPQAEIFQEYLPDGSFRYIAYASTSSTLGNSSSSPDKR